MKKLVDSLQHKLGIFTENAIGPNDPEVMESWRTICSLEAESVLFPNFVLRCATDISPWQRVERRIIRPGTVTCYWIRLYC